jgi:hypothetical protein
MIHPMRFFMFFLSIVGCSQVGKDKSTLINTPSMKIEHDTAKEVLLETNPYHSPNSPECAINYEDVKINGLSLDTDRSDIIRLFGKPDRLEFDPDAIVGPCNRMYYGKNEYAVLVENGKMIYFEVHGDQLELKPSQLTAGNLVRLQKECKPVVERIIDNEENDGEKKYIVFMHYLERISDERLLITIKGEKIVSVIYDNAL